MNSFTTLFLAGCLVLTNAMVIPQPQRLQPSTSGPCQCSMVASTNSALLLQFESATIVFVVELNQLQRDFAPTAKHTINIDNQPLKFDLSHHKWMSGSVVDHLGSTARVHVDTSTPNLCDGVSGALHLANETYVLEQVKGELRINQQSDILAQAEALGYKCEHQNTDDADSTNGQDTDRQRRTDTPKRACEVFLDADLSFFEQWKGDCKSDLTLQECLETQVERVTIKMVDALHMVDEIYRSNAVVGAILELHLAGTHIHTANHFAIDGTIDSDDALQLYENWLDGNHRGDGVPTSDSVCLNHLFTSAQFLNKNDLGVARQGGQDFKRKLGVCGSNGLNSGLSTSTYMHHSTMMEHWLTVRVIAHEIGHNLGASHDDGTNCGGGFLMNADLNSQQNNETMLSQCTVNNIFSTISQLEDNNVRRARMCLTEIKNPWLTSPPSPAWSAPPTTAPTESSITELVATSPTRKNNITTTAPAPPAPPLPAPPLPPLPLPPPTSSPPSSPPSTSPTPCVAEKLCPNTLARFKESAKSRDTDATHILLSKKMTVQDCAVKCISFDGCVAFNYKSNVGKCFLLSEGSSSTTRDIWSYFEMPTECRA